MTEDLTYVEDQPLSEEEKELLDTVYTRLDIFRDKCEPAHTEAKKCREIVHMRDPDQEQNPRAKKKTLQLHTLKSTLDNVVADQMENMPEAKLNPESAALQELVDDLQDAVHYVVYVANDFDELQKDRASDFYTTGTAITQIGWDPDMHHGKGEIALFRYPLEAFLWDPYADTLQDCRAVMKLSWHPKSWYESHYPEKAKYVTCDDQEDAGKTTAQEGAKHAADEDRALLIEYWYREYDSNKRKYTINVAYCAGHALLEDHKNVYAHGMYPFVLDIHDKIEGTIVGEGLVHQFAAMMRYINRYAAYLDMNARMSSKGRVIMRRGSGINPEEFADWERDIVEGDRVVQGEDWNWIQNAPFNGSIQQMMLQFQTELKQDSGANQFTRGETTGGIVSGKAINSLIEAGGKISHLRTDQLNSGFKKIVEQILWLMAEFYDDERMELICGRADKSKAHRKVTEYFGKPNKGAVPPPPYTVQIEVITRDPQRIANQNQMFMEAYTMAAQAQQFFPLSSLFEILNLDGKDKIMPVIRANETVQQQMQMQQQQIEQLSQQLQGMQQENENLRTTATNMTNALANINATTGGGFTPQSGAPAKAGEAGGGPTTQAAEVNNARTALL